MVKRWLGLMMIAFLTADAVAVSQGPTTLSRPGQIPESGVTGPRDRPKPATGTARIRGVVVGGEGGAPLRRAFVRLSGAELREGRMTSTDEQGRWELNDLPAGRYSLSVSKAGYVSLQYGQRRPFEQGRPIELSDGQRLDNLDFNLPRGSAISGRVTDEFGEPLSDVMVAPMRYRFFNRRRQLVPVGRFSTSDDGGNFRLYGLAPGDYYLSATLQDFEMNESDIRSGYAPTYYPGTGSPQQAEKITLGVAGEASGIVLSLLPVRTAKVSGTATDSQGRPMAGAFVSLIEASAAAGFMMFGGGNQVRDDGTFTLQNVSPGVYTLTVGGMGPPGEGQQASVPLTVTGDDITGVALVATKGVAIKGRIVFDTQPPAGTVQPASFDVQAMPMDQDGPMFFGMSDADRVDDDWTFELRAIVGTVLIRLGRTPPGFSLKSVFWRGEDVTDSGIALKPGSATTGVEIVITARTSTVAGNVSAADGKLTTDYVAVIFAEDSEHWGFQSRQIAIGRPDQQGGFVVKSLPSGSYLAAAVPYIEEGEERNPETLERLRSVATAFTLADGERKDLSLKLTEY
jgi:Carboxypeptidase regulatory-like domain